MPRVSALVSSLFTAIVVVATTLAVAYLVVGRWVHAPAHSTVEATGAMLALAIAALLRWGRELYEDPHLEWVTAALLGQGILDLVHAVVPGGPAFFWSRALPTLLGGLVLALVWINPGRRGSWLPAGVSAAAAVLAALLLVAPGLWPPAFSTTGDYTSWAKLLNVGGGAGFLVAAGFFIRRHAVARQLSDAAFAGHCSLFGLAGFTFWLASLWDAAWWALHVLRLLAYLVSLGYVVDLARRLAARQRHQLEVELAAQMDELAALRRQLGAEGKDAP